MFQILVLLGRERKIYLCKTAIKWKTNKRTVCKENMAVENDSMSDVGTGMRK